MTGPSRTQPARRIRAGSRLRLGVRARITVLAAAVVAVGLTAGAVLLVALLRQNLLRGIDAASLTDARQVAAAVSRPGVPVGSAVAPVSGEGTLAQVVQSGRVLAASPQLRELTPLMPLAPLAPSPSGTWQQDDVEVRIGDDTRELRVTAVGARRPDGSPVVVLVARSVAPVEDATEALSGLLVLAVPLLTALVGAGTWRTTALALRPVERIRRQVDEIGAGVLDRRVPVPASGDEVTTLAVTMNRMLARLEAAATAQRRFVSDASHELRSPLAGARTMLEVAQQHGEPAEWPGVVEATLGELDRLGRLVDDLLLLARADERGLSGRREEVDLDDVVQGYVGQLRRARPDLRVTALVEPVRVLADGQHLQRVVRNVVDNAAAHARRRVEVEVACRSGQAVLEVADDGPGVPHDQRDRVFGRFVRLDSSRSRHGGGTGLGLAIVREVVTASGGTVAFVGDGPGARLRVTLPAGPIGPAGLP